MTVLAFNRNPVSPATKQLVAVVGYDGTRGAQHALDHAAELLQWRDGTLEVVYVSHLPASAALSPAAVGELLEGQDDHAAALAEDVRSQLAGRAGPGGPEPTWHFQRRDGAVASELMAVAAELRGRYGDAADIAIVVGGPGHRYHHMVGSVGAALVHADRFPVIVVP